LFAYNPVNNCWKNPRNGILAKSSGYDLWIHAYLPE